MKLRFKLAAALTAAVLGLGLCGFSLSSSKKTSDSSIPDAPTDSYVLDQANILSDDTENFVNQRSQALNDSCGAQFAVVTVEYTGTKSTEEYCLSIANSWGVGDSDKNNGVVLLLVPGADDYWCMQGKGLENTLPTSTISSILQDDMEPYWLKQDYDSGTQQTIEALYQEICSIYDIDPESSSSGSTGTASQNTQYNADNVQYRSQRGSFGMIFWILLILIIILLLFPHGSDRGGRGGGGGGGSWLPWLLLWGTTNRRYRDHFREPRDFGGRGGFGGGFGGGRGGFGGGGFGGGFGGGRGGFGGGGFGGGGFGGGGFHGGGAGRGR